MFASAETFPLERRCSRSIVPGAARRALREVRPAPIRPAFVREVARITEREGLAESARSEMAPQSIENVDSAPEGGQGSKAHSHKM